MLLGKNVRTFGPKDRKLQKNWESTPHTKRERERERELDPRRVAWTVVSS